MNDILTVAQVAELSGISIRGVNKAIERGQLHASRFGNAWMIERDDVYSWMNWRAMPRRIRSGADGTKGS